MCSRYWLNGDAKHTRMELCKESRGIKDLWVFFFKGCHDLAEGAVLSNQH